MELRRALLALCLLAVSIAEPQISVSIPSLLKSASSQKACLTAKRHTDPLTVQVFLQVYELNYTIINEEFPAGDVFKTYDLQVPEVNETTPVFLIVKADSINYNYTARRSLVIVKTGNVAFIRTDKELYKGGQTVQIYVLSLNDNLKPVKETFTAIYVLDPSGNRLHQWLDQSTNGAFLVLSFTLLDDPDFGYYQIIAERKNGASISKRIKLEDYALPKFNVMVKAPDTITIMDKQVPVVVTSRYTYNQGVPGVVSGRLCRPPSNYYPGNPCNKDPDGICVAFTGMTDSEGAFKTNVSLLTLQLDRSGYQMSCRLQVTLTENGTNVQMTERKNMYITSQLGRVYFDSKVTLDNYKKGIPFPLGIIVENGLQQPENGKVVELHVDRKHVANLTADENGKARYNLDTSEFTSSGIQLQVIYSNEQQCYDNNWIVPSYSNDYRYVGRFFSRTSSFVQLQGPEEELECGKEYNIRVQYSFGKDALATGETTIKFTYMLISRATLVDSGEYSVDVSSSLKGEFNLNYKALVEHVPIVQFVVQYMLKDELVGDVLTLNLENCLKHQVSANFSSEMGTPGSNVDLTVTADPNSVCLTRVADYSLLLLEKGQSFTAATVYNALEYNRLNGYYIGGFDVSPPQPSCINADKQLLINGLYWQPINFPQEDDVRKVFANIGVHVISSTPYEQPQLCSQPLTFDRFPRPEVAFFSENVASPAFSTATTNIAANVGAAPAIVSRRDRFPELWYCRSTYVGVSGSTLIPLEVPGTITQWKSDLLCVSNQTGLGLTKYPANFTAFQKMFADVSMTNSIIRGEIMLLIASVANYMDKCAKVRVSLESTDAYTAEPADADPVKCVCSHERVSYTWRIDAKSLGVAKVSVTAETIHIGEKCDGPADPNEPNRIDTIVRTFEVEPEGIRQEVTQTNLVCVKGSENSELPVSINPSGDIVQGSESAVVQVMGEMLGRSLINPESLIKEPMGCAEQNLAAMMPIVRAVEFLNLTGRLTEEIRQRAVQNMATGYVRQMRYRHSDGSFSAFGPGSSTSSAWLTLLCLNTLWAMKPYIFMDDKVFSQGILYLERLQEANGRFKPVGSLFNTGLKGGADDDVGFTCAMVIFLLKTTYATTPSLLRPAVAYLEQASQKDQTVYNYAMLFHAFRVVGNKELAKAMREKLWFLAIDEGNSLHWERPIKPQQNVPRLFAPQPATSELELTSIVLIAMAHGESSSTVSQEDLNNMTKISNWLVKGQNIHGSYRTTSDTVSVMTALCDYGALVIQKDAANIVQLTLDDQVVREFNVDQPSRILLQTEVLTQVTGNYKMVVSGNGCVLLQTGVRFNVPVNPENSAFSLSLTTFQEDCKNGVAYRVNIQVNASYHGIQNTSGMAVLKLPQLSGYSTEPESLAQLRSKFPKVETKNNLLIVYFNDMDSEGVSFTVVQEMGAIVDNFQQRTAFINAYYESDENGSASLFHPCTLKS